MLHTWHKIEGINTKELPDLKLTEVQVAGKRIGLLKKGEVIHAFAGTCPHAGVALCTGWLDAQGRIVCPEHKYRFDPANGRNTSGEGYKLFIYPVQIRGDELYVGIIPS
jgi:3-phenylpropionate/trans-cinnamate dioxygenase ferredoxin subunit